MRPTVFRLACLLLPIAAVAAADPWPQLTSGDAGVLHGEVVGAAAAKQDTLYLLGGPGRLDGKFETEFGAPAWHGWTSIDWTFSPDHHWSVTDDPALVCGTGDRSLWVGTFFAGEPGYGNSWHQSVLFAHAVDPGLVNTVRWQFTISYDSEPGYDFTHAQYNLGGTWLDLQSWDGAGTADFDQTFQYEPGDYVGPLGDQFQLRILFSSDGAWSDEDGLRPTARGAARIDDIVVHLNTNLIESEDFEGLPTSQPGEQMAFGNWIPVIDPGAGDYAALYTNLGDLDPCGLNLSPQVAFIDDGLVVPGTGGTLGQTWTYGPGGYIVNNTGGLMGPEHYIHNGVISPPLEVPPQVGGITLAFDVYRHEELGDMSVWPGMFYTWSVRSTSTGDPADLEHAAWRSFNFVYYGGPNYQRETFNVTGLLAQGRTHVQVALSVYDGGWVYGWVGTDGTPAPYFDNVAVVGYPIDGPTITARGRDLFQDNFPASGILDHADLGANSIRLDMARNLTPTAHAPHPNTPGDSIVLDIKAVRHGYSLNGMPRLYFAIRPNPLFAAVRDLSDPTLLDVQIDGASGVITGVVSGRDTINPNTGGWIRDRYNFDLPDESFFFPGDILHYYVEAQDILGGDPGTVGTTRLPADIDFFGDFDQRLKFSRTFTVRGLPTLFSDTPGDQPNVLWWNDYDTRGGENEWLNALANLGYQHGVDFDMYYTTDPSANAGNGLGGRATSAQLAHYDVLLYTSGTLSRHVLGVGDLATEPGDDIGLLTAWFALGGKKALLTGDDLVTSLINTGGAAQVFLDTYVGVQRLQQSIRNSIGNQPAPVVRPVAGNGVIDDDRAWIAYSGCPRLNTFDGVEPVGAAERLAYFTPPGGEGDPYPYAAAVRHHHAADQATVIYLPYDFMFVHDLGSAGKALPARALLLGDILASFGQHGGSAPTGVAPDAILAATAFPNPFNPSTTIKLTLPRTGQVGLKVFNVRGELVRTLVDGRLEAGVHDIVWDGTTERGGQAASGVYFFSTQANGKLLISKGTLVK